MQATTPKLVFYDIKFREPQQQFSGAPNPWKARYALNFKNVDYSSVFVDILDIPTVRKGLGVPAGRKFPDGSDYYTLPVLIDSTTGAKVGDSFDIAVYLQKTYPDSGAGNLFPELPDESILDFSAT